MLRRHLWWLAPLAGAAVAGAIVAAVSFGGGSCLEDHAEDGPRPASSRRRRRSPSRTRSPRSCTSSRPRSSRSRPRRGSAPGIVFDSNGDIVTNNHVVGGSDGGPFTVTAGAHSYGASLVGRFAPDDLAVVRVSGRASRAGDVRGLERAGGRRLRDRDRQSARASARASPTGSSAPSGPASRRGTASRCRS